MTAKLWRSATTAGVWTCAIAMASSALTAQAPPRDSGLRAPAVAATGTAVLSGVVVSAGTDAKPLRLASVVIIGATTGTLRVTSSDANGRFSFTGLPADRYVVGASKPPFLGAVAGARRPARTGTPIVVKNGETVANVTVRLPPGAAISGYITDERGEPGTGVLVGLQQRRSQGGERVLVPVANTTATDERGRYRIHSLPPGEYLVVAMRQGGVPARALTAAEVDAALKGARVASAAPVSTNMSYAPVYFPGTTREANAASVPLAAGEERQNVDLRLELVTMAIVEGRVTASDGQPVPGVTISFGSAANSGPLQFTQFGRAGPDGRFRFANMTPGTYTLLAREPGQASRFATAQVEVAGVDQFGLQLTLAPPLTISARLAFEGLTPAPALRGRRVPLRNLGPAVSPGTGPQVGPTSGSGAFTVTGLVPGQYVLGGPLFFGASSDSVTWALQSVVVDGRDVTDLPLTIASDALPKDVVVTYSDRWQELSGQIRQPTGAAVSEHTIVLFPADKAYWLSGSRRILTARPGTDGRFRLGGPGPGTVPAGAYLMAAVTDLDRDEQFDPAFLSALVASAVAVTIQPGEQKIQDVVIK